MDINCPTRCNNCCASLSNRRFDLVVWYRSAVTLFFLQSMNVFSETGMWASKSSSPSSKLLLDAMIDFFWLQWNYFVRQRWLYRNDTRSLSMWHVTSTRDTAQMGRGHTHTHTHTYSSPHSIMCQTSRAIARKNITKWAPVCGLEMCKYFWLQTKEKYSCQCSLLFSY